MRLVSRSIHLAAVACLGTILTAAAANADPIPREWLQAQHAACVKSCTAGAKTAAVCETYCTCIDRGFAASLTKDDYLAIDTAMKSGQPIAAPLSAKVQTVTGRCRAQ